MSGAMARRILLGPEQADGAAVEAIERLSLPGPVCSISAGWQEAEADPARLPGSVTDLRLQARAEDLFARVPALFAAHRQRQDRLLALQRFYRLRLTHALDAVRALDTSVAMSAADGQALALHRREALNLVRALDRQHLRQVRKEHLSFVGEWGADNNAEVSAARADIAGIVNASGSVIITGGHAAALLNRVMLFDLAGLLQARTLVAWGAGAMLLGGLMVLYDDNAPQGARDPELLADGLGLASGLVSFPRARERLDLADRTRLATLARRIAPLHGVTLDAGCVVEAGETLSAWSAGAHRMRGNGRLLRIEMAS